MYMFRTTTRYVNIRINDNAQLTAIDNRLLDNIVCISYTAIAKV